MLPAYPDFGDIASAVDAVRLEQDVRRPQAAGVGGGRGEGRAVGRGGRKIGGGGGGRKVGGGGGGGGLLGVEEGAASVGVEDGASLVGVEACIEERAGLVGWP